MRDPRGAPPHRDVPLLRRLKSLTFMPSIFATEDDMAEEISGVVSTAMRSDRESNGNPRTRACRNGPIRGRGLRTVRQRMCGVRKSSPRSALDRVALRTKSNLLRAIQTCVYLIADGTARERRTANLDHTRNFIIVT